MAITIIDEMNEVIVPRSFPERLDKLEKSIHNAYHIGMVHGKLELAKGDLLMGDAKNALHKLNEAIKHLESEIISDFYKKTEVKMIEEKGDSNENKK